MLSILKRLGELLVALAILASLPLATSPVHAQGATQVVVTPADIQIAAGQTAQVDMQVVNVQGLYGFDVGMTFDPNAVEVVGQIALGPFLDSGFIVLNSVDNTTGAIRFAMTQVNPSESKSGSGTLISVILKGKTAGAISAITLTRGDLASRDALGIPSTLVSGRVSVALTSQQTPGATLSVTPIPTTTQPAVQTPTTLPANATAIPTTAPRVALPGTTLIPTAVPQTPAPNTPIATAITALTANPPTQVAPTALPSTLAPGTTPAPEGQQPTSLALTTATDVGSQPATTVDTLSTIEPTAPAPGETSNAIVPLAATTEDLTSTPPPGSTAQSPGGVSLEPTAVQVASNALPVAPRVQVAGPAETGRGLSSPFVQTVLVFGSCGIGLLLFVVLVAAFFRLLQLSTHSGQSDQRQSR